ncbi:MAG TPA: DNA translocase FtsK, partial [Candidatus Baltobacteraceae bacterium]|nr:DNA translocase FtsK [Candidatus Baltobacteraceae bacterium]
MARVRRKATAKTRLNFEIAGIAAIGLAALFAVALALPSDRGVLGAGVATLLKSAFGHTAPLFPLVVALFGAIVFLELDVPRLIARHGTAAVCFFLIIDALLAPNGGAVGGGISWALQSLVGSLGAHIVLYLAALSIAVWITDVSLKKLIGLLVIALGKIKLPKVRFALPERAALPKPQARAPKIAPPAVRAEPQVFDDAFADEDRFAPPAVYEAPAQQVIDPEPIVQAAAPKPVKPVPAAPPKPVQHGDIVYQLPDLSLFDPPQVQVADDSSRSSVLEDTLASFGVGAKVVHIERGPSITRYELKPERGVKISKIASLADDIALALAATSVRIEAPIPGKSAVGIEVPNKSVSVVAIK